MLPLNSKRIAPLLDVRNVSFTYPSSGLSVLSGMNVSVGRGEVVVMVGPSGCGKSTLLSVIVGSLEPDYGTTTWTSSEAADSTNRRPVTMLFQSDTLLPWKSVQANITFALNAAQVPNSELETRSDHLLEMADLTKFRHVRPAALSGGMRRRAGLIMAMAPLPELVVMDEPFSSVDEPTRVGIHKAILDIVRDLDVTLLLVTHDVAEAVTLADRVYVLSKTPSCAVEEFSVPFGRERDVYAIRETDEYHQLYSKVWHRLRAEIHSDTRD